MTAIPIDQRFQHALEQHRAGHTRKAQALYEDVLREQPEHPGANHHLGWLALQSGQPQTALPYLRRALEADPTPTSHWSTYAEALLAVDQPEAAEAILALAKARGLDDPVIEALMARLPPGVGA